MDLLPESHEVPEISYNRIYISATKNTNVGLLREMIKLKANKLLNKFPFRFIHSPNEHTSRLSWLFDNANFEDDSGVEFADDRPLLFSNGYMYFDGYLNEPVLNAYKREFGGGSEAGNVFGFRMNWSENFESFFEQSESNELVSNESLKEMQEYLDKCEKASRHKVSDNGQNRTDHFKKIMRTKLTKNNRSNANLERMKTQRKEEKNYQSSLKSELNIPSSWNK